MCDGNGSVHCEMRSAVMSPLSREVGFATNAADEIARKAAAQLSQATTTSEATFSGGCNETALRSAREASSKDAPTLKSLAEFSDVLDLDETDAAAALQRLHAVPIASQSITCERASASNQEATGETRTNAFEGARSELSSSNTSRHKRTEMLLKLGDDPILHALLSIKLMREAMS